MKFDTWKQHTGRCAACGKPTALKVHQHCGERLARPKSHRGAKAAPYRAGFLRHIAKVTA